MTREMRGGLKGFYIVLTCLAVSSFTLTASNSFTQSLTHQLQREGRTILGGDAELRRVQLPFSLAEKKFFEKNSQRISLIAQMRVMTQTPKQNAPAQLKSVDQHWPLVGTVKLDAASAGVKNVRQALRARVVGKKKIYGVVASRDLLSALNIKIGDQFLVGAATMQLRAIFLREPDGLADGFSFVPRLLVSQEALAATQLVQPGSLINYRARFLLGADSARVDRFAQKLKTSFPHAGWQLRTHRDSSPSLRRFIERVSMFLTLAALTTFLISGIGIANAVSSWFAQKRATIATLKCLGAPTRIIAQAYLAQILLMACLGVLIGVLLGVAAPFLLIGLLSNFLPLPVQAEFNLAPVFLALIYSLLITLLFSLIPIALAKATPPSHLFRAHIAPPPLRQIGFFWWLAVAAVASTLFLIALFLSPERSFALYFLSGAVASLVLLYLIGAALISALRLLPAIRHPLWRIAVANIIRPGAQSRNIIMALGMGLALLSAVALIDGNLRDQIERGLPSRAPSFFIADIHQDQKPAFTNFLKSQNEITNVKIVPLLRGQIVKINALDAATHKTTSDVAWVLRGDRGLTFAARPPDGTSLTQGSWWPENYQGPPLLSIGEDVAKGMDLTLGDHITINLLGTLITATISNIRKINWAEGGMNFVLIFSPKPFDQIPVTYFSTMHVRDGAIQKIRAQITKQFPNIVVIETGQALSIIADLMQQIATAARLASSWTLIAGILVLAAAMAASFRQKLAEAVIFKVLGAKRGLIARASAAEYILLGAAAALAALLISTYAAWAVITFLWRAEWIFLPQVFLLTLAAAIVIAIGCGIIINHRVLAQKPAPWLRQISQ